MRNGHMLTRPQLRAYAIRPYDGARGANRRIGRLWGCWCLWQLTWPIPLALAALRRRALPEGGWRRVSRGG